MLTSRNFSWIYPSNPNPMFQCFLGISWYIVHYRISLLSTGQKKGSVLNLCWVHHVNLGEIDPGWWKMAGDPKTMLFPKNGAPPIFHSPAVVIRAEVTSINSSFCQVNPSIIFPWNDTIKGGFPPNHPSHWTILGLKPRCDLEIPHFREKPFTLW